MPDKTITHKAFDEIKTFSVEHFSHIMVKALAHAEKACIQLLSNVTLAADEIDHIQKSQTFLQQSSEDIVTKILKEFTQILKGEKLISESQQNTLSLSLVDESTLEEMILIGELTGKVQDHYEQHLKAIKRGLVRMTKQMEFEPEPDAITPKRLALLLHEPLETAELGLENKRMIYSAFAEIASIELQNVYDGILAILQDYEIISESENPSSENFKIIYQYRQERAKNKRSEQTIQATEIQTSTNSPLAPAQLEPIAAKAVNAALFDDSEMSRNIYGLLTSQPAHHVPADPSLPTVESSDLVKLLSSLQNLNTLELAEAALSDSSAISNTVNSTISNKIKEWSKNVSGPESNVIELINNMFVSIFEDPDLIDPVKVQIGRLQIPYIKVALLDITLLNQDTHPARLLLNELAALGIQINDRTETLFTTIQTITQTVLDNFESDLNVFTENLEKLRELKKSYQEENQEQYKTTKTKAESQAKLLHLKGIVVRKLRLFLKGKTLPKELHSLILKGFAPLLLKIYSRHGEDSSSWQETSALIRQVIESVQPRKSLSQISIVVKRSQELLEKTKTMLTSQQPNKSNPTELYAGLEKIYQRKSEEYAQLKENTFPELEADESDPFAAANDPLEEIEETQDAHSTQGILEQLPESLVPGVFCEVYAGRDKKAQKLKLTSILADSQQLVFINVAGDQSHIKDMSEFVDELDCERSKILDDNNLFDKALTAVVSNMQMMRANPSL